MAKNNTKKAKAPVTQGSGKKGESDGLVHGLLTVLLSILIVLVVFGGAFYYVLKNDMYGLGEQFRPSLQRIPILRQALPPLPASADPDSPIHLTQRELLEKYNGFRVQNKELTTQVEELKQALSELEQEKEQWVLLKEEATAIQMQNEAQIKSLEDQKAQLQADRNALSELIANGNKEGFKEYYSKVEPEKAKEIYAQLVNGDMVSQEIKNLAKPYAEMDAANAANILTELGNKDMPLLIDLLNAMKSNVAAEIMENMEPAFAAGVMQHLADKKLQTNP